MGYGFNHEGRAFYPDGATPTPETQGATDARNRETSAQEVAAFKARAADQWFGYWWSAPGAPFHPGIGEHEIRTWMGDTLARVTWIGHEYKCGAFGPFPSVRQNFRAKGIDGREWSGTYFKSSGDYVRMRAVKG